MDRLSKTKSKNV